MNKLYKITQFGLVLGGHLILITIIVFGFLEIQNQGTIVFSLKINVLLILIMWKTLKETMVMMAIVSFFQSFDNHDYILELALLFNNENQGYEPYKLLWFCFCSYNHSTLVWMFGPKVSIDWSFTYMPKLDL